ncbi:MAG: exonuclease domain-containing protein [Paracoccaceae bacterium]|nr:exonuclease domain-containing protein [Paracoccaceae bacterium]
MFAFYDFETTGTSPKYDQPLQFAAILTDDDLNPVERINIRCRLAPHIIPAPWAMAVTGVTPEMLTDGTLPSWFEFTQSLREIIRRWAPATWTGYNSLAFDEQFFRQSFFQCLQPNFYETQFNGNQRLDVMKVVFSCWELARDVLEWPLDDHGRQSFKLDRLAPANGFTQHAAHDALGDVEATIHIVRRIKEGAPEVWAQCLANRSKHQVNALLETGQPLRLVERFGARPPRSYFGCLCGRSPDNPNSVGFYDLDGGDPTVLMEGANDAVMAAVSASPKRIRTVAVNNVPSLFEKEPVDPLHKARAALIAARPDFHIRVGKALAGRYADAERSEHVEDQIYDGFYSNADRVLLDELQTASWERRAELRQMFEDERLRRLALRLLFLEAPHHLRDDERIMINDALQGRWRHAGDAEWTTLADAEHQLVEIEDARTVEPKAVRELRQFYQRFGV